MASMRPEPTMYHRQKWGRARAVDRGAVLGRDRGRKSAATVTCRAHLGVKRQQKKKKQGEGKQTERNMGRLGGERRLDSARMEDCRPELAVTMSSKCTASSALSESRARPCTAATAAPEMPCSSLS